MEKTNENQILNLNSTFEDALESKLEDEVKEYYSEQLSTKSKKSKNNNKSFKLDQSINTNKKLATIAEYRNETDCSNKTDSFKNDSSHQSQYLQNSETPQEFNVDMLNNTVVDQTNMSMFSNKPPFVIDAAEDESGAYNKLTQRTTQRDAEGSEEEYSKEVENSLELSPGSTSRILREVYDQETDLVQNSVKKTNDECQELYESKVYDTKKGVEISKLNLTLKSHIDNSSLNDTQLLLDNSLAVGKLCHQLDVSNNEKTVNNVITGLVEDQIYGESIADSFYEGDNGEKLDTSSKMKKYMSNSPKSDKKDITYENSHEKATFSQKSVIESTEVLISQRTNQLDSPKKSSFVSFGKSDRSEFKDNSFTPMDCDENANKFTSNIRDSQGENLWNKKSYPGKDEGLSDEYNSPIKQEEKDIGCYSHENEGFSDEKNSPVNQKEKNLYTSLAELEFIKGYEKDFESLVTEYGDHKTRTQNAYKIYNKQLEEYRKKGDPSSKLKFFEYMKQQNIIVESLLNESDLCHKMIEKFRREISNLLRSKELSNIFKSELLESTKRTNDDTEEMTENLEKKFEKYEKFVKDMIDSLSKNIKEKFPVKEFNLKNGELDTSLLKLLLTNKDESRTPPNSLNTLNDHANNDELTRLANELKQYTGRCTYLEQDIKAKDQRIKGLDKEIDVLNESLKNAQKKITASEIDLTKSQLEFNEKQEQMDQNHNELNDAFQAHNDIAQELTDTQEQLEKQQLMYEEKTKENSRLDHFLKNLEIEKKDLQNELQKFKEYLIVSNQKVENYTKETEDQKITLENYKDELSEVTFKEHTESDNRSQRYVF